MQDINSKLVMNKMKYENVTFEYSCECSLDVASQLSFVSGTLFCFSDVTDWRMCRITCMVVYACVQDNMYALASFYFYGSYIE